jgi:hypothetical protein
VGGSNHISPSPATTVVAPTSSSARPVEADVATSTPAAGPTMKESSTPIESTA